MMRSSQSSRISSGKNLLLLALAALVSMGVMACDDEGIVTDTDAQFHATPNPIEFAPIGTGETAVQTVTIENRGQGILEVRNIELINTEGDALSPQGDWPEEILLESGESEFLAVQYAPTDEIAYDGYIQMTANTQDPTQVVDIVIPGFQPEIFVDPGHVDFPQTPAGSEEWRVAQIYNIGGGTLQLNDVFLSEGEGDFAISFIDSRTPDGGFPPRDQDSDTPPATLEPGDDPIYMRVLFTPEDEEPKHGAVFIGNNDQDLTVNLSGNSGDACLEVADGNQIDFGPASIHSTTYLTVTLRNCSPEAELELYDISVSDDGGGVFMIQPGAELDAPYVLMPGEVTTTVLGFSPNEEVEYNGELHIESNDSMNPDRYIPITGVGVDAECPVAEATGSVGMPGAGSDLVFATNQDVVYLSSDGSYDPDGTDLDYEWSVIARPDGSLSDVQPSPFQPNPEFEVDIVGQFQIELVVYDETGLRNCNPAIVQIDATPDEDIHIQLVWSTPEVDATYGGPNGSAGIGTDLDIHYVNSQDGIDQWGSTNSIYWLRPTQSWPGHGEARLDIDDLYGEMPENINHSDPGMNGMFRVGVHYFSDNGWGAADATVRIYFGVSLYGQWDRRLEHTDNFWYVGNIVWTENPYVDVLDDLQPTHALTSADG